MFFFFFFTVLGFAAINLKIVFLPLLAFELTILIDNFRYSLWLKNPSNSFLYPYQIPFHLLVTIFRCCTCSCLKYSSQDIALSLRNILMPFVVPLIYFIFIFLVLWTNEVLIPWCVFILPYVHTLMPICNLSYFTLKFIYWVLRPKNEISVSFLLMVCFCLIAPYHIDAFFSFNTWQFQVLVVVQEVMHLLFTDFKRYSA